VNRWQSFTGKAAIHAETGQTFEDVTEARKDDSNDEVA
jgi:hypothetical protein